MFHKGYLHTCFQMINDQFNTQKYQENEFASKKTRSKIEGIASNTNTLHKELIQIQKQQKSCVKDLQKFSSFSNQVKSTLEHCKQKIESLEKNQITYSEKIAQISKLKDKSFSIVLKEKSFELDEIIVKSERNLIILG